MNSSQGGGTKDTWVLEGVTRCLGKPPVACSGCIAIWNALKNTARLIEAGQRIALTRLEAGDAEWTSILQSAGVKGAFDLENEAVTRDAAVDWMLRSRANPSSVLSCIESARHNARLVRTALTGEVWAATNAAYMRIREKSGAQGL